MPWYHVTHVDTADNENLFQQFKTFYLSKGAPPDLALFSVTSATDGHMESYLTPEAGLHPALLQMFEAVECERPPSSAKLEMGHQDAADRFSKGEL